MTATAQRNMAVGKVNAFVVVVHNKRSPKDEEWHEYLQVGYGMGVDHGTLARYLVLTDGGAPTLKQQRILSDTLSPVLRQHPSALRVAIVTPSTFAYGVVTALSILRMNLRAFTPQDMHGAYEYLGIPPAYFGDVEALIKSLRTQLRDG